MSKHLPTVGVLRDWLLDRHTPDGGPTCMPSLLEDPAYIWWAGKLLDAPPELLDQAAREIYNHFGGWPVLGNPWGGTAASSHVGLSPFSMYASANGPLVVWRRLGGAA